MKMTKLLRKTRLIAICWLLVSLGPVLAEAVLVGPGDIVRSDFDLSSEFPAPPYSNITAFFAFGSDLLDPGEGWTVSIFDSENGPALNSVSFSNPFPPTTGIFQGVFGFPSPPAFSDGAGFLLFTTIVGTFDLTAVQFSGTNPGGHTPFVDGTITVIPEPTAFSLMVVGLAGLSVACCGWLFHIGCL